MFFTLEKFQRRVQELGQRRWRDMTSIAPMTCMEDAAGPDDVHCVLPAEIAGGQLGIGDLFVGRDRYLWARKTVALPPAREGCEVAGLFDFGMTGGGGNSGFEAMLYLDGHPYQGVDSNHREVILTPAAGREATITFLLWSGLEGGGAHRDMVHRAERMDVGYLDKTVNKLYYLAKAVTQSLAYVAPEAVEHQRLTAALEHALRAIDWDTDRFYETAPRALEILGGELDAIGKREDVTVHTVGHTHIDVAWLWRLKNTREKAMRSFATVTRLMEEYDDYVFLQSQPQLYQYIRSDCPELYERIRDRVREGRWETDGGMWLEADCNISSGEALVRQFLHGITFFREEFGQECRYLWLPDVFGYSWALPQIMRQCGLSTFATTKISWNQYNTMPNDLFSWRGIDGTEVMTYFVNTPEESQPADSRFATYNGLINAHSVMGSWKKFRNKNLAQDVLISYGYGDGGGGPTREMLELRRALDRLPGVPNVRNGKAGDFFEKLHRSLETTDEYVPTWDGELYLEYHRGTYTTQGRNKRMNRKLEFALAEAEWFSCLSSLEGGSYDSAALHEGWETVLRNQFHDIIPGSSIHEVYEDSQKEYAAVAASLADVCETALSAACRAEKDHCAVFSFSSFPTAGPVFVPEERDGSFKDAHGSPLASQKCSGGWMVAVPCGPLSAEAVAFVPGAAPQAVSPFTYDPGKRTLRTPFYEAQWDETGALCRLYDVENGRDALRGRGNVLEIYEDKPMNYDAWDVDIFYRQKKETLSAGSAPTVTAEGPLLLTLRFLYTYRRSKIEQDVTFYAGSRRIDFATHVDWHEDHRLLKAAFETDIRSTKASYDIQFGHVERPTHWNTSWDWARFEVCGHKWADLSETGYGTALLNDCKYGYAIRDNVMTLSLLKSAKSPDTEADMGEHRFTYAFLPHAGGPADGGVIEEANALNLPAVVRTDAVPAHAGALVRLSGDGAAIDAVKRAEDGDGVIVRLHECRGGTHAMTITSDRGVGSWTVCDLLEKAQGEAQTGDSAAFTLHPFEIKTFRLSF